MLWTSALAIYLLFWFLCLFLVLPFHGRRDQGNEAEPPMVLGQDIGAPPDFPVLRAVIQVTIVSAIAFAIYYAAYVSGYFTRETLNFLPGPPDR